MKNNNLLLAALSMIILCISCYQEPDLPVLLHEDLEKGAFPRLLNFEGSFYLTDVGNSEVSWEVEFYDEAQGTHVTEYVWTVSYVDQSGGVGPSETLLATISQSDFTTHSESGLPSTSAIWTFQEILDVFGFEPSDINEGDEFNFFATLKRDDGKEFNTVNTGDNIESSAPFNGFFRFTMPVRCSSDLGGVMRVVGTGWCGDTWGDDPNFPYEIEWVNEGNGIYNLNNGDFAFGAYQACLSFFGFPTDGTANPAHTLRIKDTCHKLSFVGASRWGDIFQFNEVSVDGPDLYIDWNNDYPLEAGTAVITRTDGKDWPPLSL